MELKNIALVLENCEVVTIDKKNLGHFYIGDIKTSYSRGDKYLVKSQICDEFIVEISRDLNQIERLHKCNDITQIWIEDVNGREEQFFVKWDENDKYFNEYQKNKLNRFGDLYIVISENKGIDDYFIDDLINDGECVNDSWTEYRNK